MEKQKHDVYGYEMKGGSISFYSKGVTREFGENRIVFVDGHQMLASVQPLQDSNGLKLMGHMHVDDPLAELEKEG
tara:strand:- start:2503 stop:2727 length:225 start_codon:yes stop_codon:yes gene_type:complete